MQTAAQIWMEQGRQEGWQQGRQEGRQEGHQEGHQEGRQEEASAFFVSQETNKRDQVIDTLLRSPDYADYFLDDSDIDSLVAQQKR